MHFCNILWQLPGGLNDKEALLNPGTRYIVILSSSIVSKLGTSRTSQRSEYSPLQLCFYPRPRLFTTTDYSSQVYFRQSWGGGLDLTRFRAKLVLSSDLLEYRLI